MRDLTQPSTVNDTPCSLARAIIAAGGVTRSASEGAIACAWQGVPRVFVLVTSGMLSVQFRTSDRTVPSAECRAAKGQDCMPVTAAILSKRALSARAVCMTPTTWLELSPTALGLLVQYDTAFRQALFAGHAKRLPSFFARVCAKNAGQLEQRIADWLLSHARDKLVHATHSDIAAEVLTAREVVSRKLQTFAIKGWIVQRRGCIQIEAPAALARVSRGVFFGRPAARPKNRTANVS